MNRELEARYLHLQIGDEIEVQVKLDDDGVVVDAFRGEPMEGIPHHIGSTWKTYAEMGVEVNEIRKATPEALTESVSEDMSIEFLEDGE